MKETIKCVRCGKAATLGLTNKSGNSINICNECLRSLGRAPSMEDKIKIMSELMGLTIS